MLAIILVSLVVVGCIIWGVIEREVFMGFIMALFFGIVTLFLSVVLACIIGIFPEKMEVFERKNIVALQDNNSIKGSFFLFSGQIDGVSYYHYMEQKDGYKVASKIRADNGSGLCVVALSRNLKLTTTLERAITQNPCYVPFLFEI